MDRCICFNLSNKRITGNRARSPYGQWFIRPFISIGCSHPIFQGLGLIAQDPKVQNLHAKQTLNDSKRRVFAFFPAGEGLTEAEKSEKMARQIKGAKVCLIKDSIPNDRRRSFCQNFASLLMTGEELLVVEAPAADVAALLPRLRTAGQPTIFVLRIEQAERESDTAKPPIIRLDQIEAVLTSALADLREAVSLGHRPTSAADWFLDNTYFALSELAEIRRNYPRTRSSLERVYQVARSLVAQAPHALTEASILEHLRESQKEKSLTLAELSSFPLFLRIGIIEQLSGLAAGVSHARYSREAAYLWADRLSASLRRDDTAVADLLRRMETESYSFSPSFVTALAELLHGQEEALAEVQKWIEIHLGNTLSTVVRAEHAREASVAVETAQAFGNLRGFTRIDFSEIFEAVCAVDAELRKDPEGNFVRSDSATRDLCRHSVEQIARWSSLDEASVAGIAVKLASQASLPRERNVAYYLIADGVYKLEQEVAAKIPLRTRLLRGIRNHATISFLTAIGSLALAFTLTTLLFAYESGMHQPALLILLGALASFPLSELAIQIIHSLVISTLPPAVLPKMDFEDGIPVEHATLVVVPMMLASRFVVRKELEKLEVRYLANREVNLSFALFSDFMDSSEPSQPGDDALLQSAADGIVALNSKYPQAHFLWFHRGREWSKSEQAWIGRERKRGKIEDLNAYLTGQGAEGILQAGTLPGPIQYVITLDADTQLPPGTGRRMIETIAHPVNKVEIDPITKVRRSGFSIIQPRVSITLPGATATRFTRIFADTTGLDPYSQFVSDIQQDLFGQGTFHGKAIYDVHAFTEILGNRFPAETLLSHDLIEGVHAGVGLATDIELLESLPLDFASFSRRQHRWIRGDWQIASWMLSHVPGPTGASVANPLCLINRWQIADNLRRSLVPIASFLLLLFGWFISTVPGVWSLVVGIAVAIPALAPLMDRWVRHIQGTVDGWQGSTDQLLRNAVMTAFLPQQALLSVDAIARSCFRRWVSHRNLLEWQTAEAAERDSHLHLNSTQQQMFGIAAMSMLLAIALRFIGELASTSVFLSLWMTSPVLLTWLNRSSPPPREKYLSGSDTLYLRKIARLTWRFFDDLVGPQTNWLPPDNSQLALRVEVAQRTSPTNIGLWLTSALAAWDFGFLTSEELCRRCAETLKTLNRMERYEGHILNWYNTSTLEPLLPRYISTVDSGNLIASLWTFQQGLEGILTAPILGNRCLHGLTDTQSVLAGHMDGHEYLSVPMKAVSVLLTNEAQSSEIAGRLRLLRQSLEVLGDAKRWESGGEHVYWATRFVEESNAWNGVVDRYLGWMETLSRPPDSFLLPLGSDFLKLRRKAMLEIPSLQTLVAGNVAVDTMLSRRGEPEMRPEAAAWLEQLAREFGQAKQAAKESASAIQALLDSVRSFVDAIQMGFLYDKQHRHLSVGLELQSPVGFTSHYDLLASECRLASLVAIAKGDVPVEHWGALGRPLGPGVSKRVLLSWSGTMFEFLMPLLFTHTYENSLLDAACREALECQLRFGDRSGLPWGISESAYSAIDLNQIYQYRAFGLAELAQNPDVDDRPVISPYSTMLALSIRSRTCMDNLKRLEALGLNGHMGFYEAIDFSREAKREGERGVAIYAYMAHHQGMSLLALDNAVHPDAMQKRFHCDPRVRAFESLLFERIPLSRLRKRKVDPRPATRPENPIPEESPERIFSGDTAIQRVQLLGNGRYSLMITNSGSGYSRWNDFDVTRWRADTTLDDWGTFIFIRDQNSGSTWSATAQPLNKDRGESSVAFSADRADFRRVFLGIESTMAVTVATEDDVEIRRLIITNRSRKQRVLEFTSFAELAMSPQGADKAHPAFSKLSIQTEWFDEGVILAHRRPRSPEDLPIWIAHFLVGRGTGRQFETDRSTFLGRGKSVHDPDALSRPLNRSKGSVLDPCFSLRYRETLNPGDRCEFSYVTIAASSREALLALVAKYQRPESVAQTFELAWTRAQLEFRYLQMKSSASHNFQQLAGFLIYPSSGPRASSYHVLRNRLGQSGLWTLGISGDLPILTITVEDERGLSLIREILSAHTYWRLRGFRVDLVILNQESSDYDRPLNFQLQRLVEAHSREAGANHLGNVFLLDWEHLSEEQHTLLFAICGAQLAGNRGSLARQLPPPIELTSTSPRFAPTGSTVELPSRPLPFLELPYFNGIGGFTGDGREYSIYLGPGTLTPSPWSNVIASPDFGTMVTESGLGFTWSGNSQQNRLTPWHNDPVVDPQSEAIYIRDNDSGSRWTPTALPIRENDAYRARHGQGYSVFEHNSHAIGQELTVFVPWKEGSEGSDRVKICRLRLRNDSALPRSLSVFYFAEWVLNTNREDQAKHVQTKFDSTSRALLAEETWSPISSNQVAFAGASPPPNYYSGDRRRFLGRNGLRANPAALDFQHLDNATGTGLDPAAVLQVDVFLAPGKQTDVTFLLGQVATRDQVSELLQRYLSSDQVEAALQRARQMWEAKLGALQVHTPHLSIDFMLNRWLLYQSLSCRFWGRSAFYQSGGAFGFRDQLQDSMALVYSSPQITRAHILESAARQFLEGDVQHWWHKESGLGVRTRCSDDLLWLPYVVAFYVEKTGDRAILEVPVAFLEAPLLTAGQQERVFVPQVSQTSAPLWEHCRLAMEHAWKLGAHGLPLIGSGDWNDGMNHVGTEGRGESVWMALFLHDVLQSIATMIRNRDSALATTYRQRASELAAAVDNSCWDGAWYLRGFFDDGSPLGSKANREARIDSLPQSWAVISGATQAERALTAMESAERELVRESEKLVLLFNPPFDNSTPYPGYIMGYPPGVRENGGQYTHGSLWMAMAWARLNQGDRAVGLLQMMNPIEHSRDIAGVNKYRGEPYVVAADVFSAIGKVGRSGWTWYTGSAAWMYRIWIEEVLGFRLEGNSFHMKPNIPTDWPGFEMTYRHHRSQYQIVVKCAASGSAQVKLDGKVLTEKRVPLEDDGLVHRVEWRCLHAKPKSVKQN